MHLHQNQHHLVPHHFIPLHADGGFSQIFHRYQAWCIRATIHRYALRVRLAFGIYFFSANITTPQSPISLSLSPLQKATNCHVTSLLVAVIRNSTCRCHRRMRPHLQHLYLCFPFPFLFGVFVLKLRVQVLIHPLSSSFWGCFAG